MKAIPNRSVPPIRDLFNKIADPEWILWSLVDGKAAGRCGSLQRLLDDLWLVLVWVDPDFGLQHWQAERYLRAWRRHYPDQVEATLELIEAVILETSRPDEISWCSTILQQREGGADGW